MSETIKNGREMPGSLKAVAIMAAGLLGVSAYLLGTNNNEENDGNAAYVSCGTEEVAVLADPETGRGKYICLDWLGHETDYKPTIYGGSGKDGLHTSNK